MMYVFCGGSRRIARLDKNICERLDNIIAKGMHIVVGDANGADKAVQMYLMKTGYENVTVFCTGSKCRNNLGDWQVEHVSPPQNAKGFAYYAEKDAAMARKANYGLMLWDGKSAGTLNNVKNLLRENKPVVVYFAPEEQFYTLNKETDLGDLLRQCEPAEIQRIYSKIGTLGPTNSSQGIFPI